MTTTGVIGIYMETHDYGAAASMWASLGFTNLMETDHSSGQWIHPEGGPYLFIKQVEADEEPRLTPILGVADPASFAPDPPPVFLKEFVSEHWGTMYAEIRDPDGRPVALEGPATE